MPIAVLSGDTVGARPERRGLETAWERAWDARALAAQSGDYAAAERWHRQALALGSALAAADRPARERRAPAARP